MRLRPPPSSPDSLPETPRCTVCRYLIVALRQAQTAGDTDGEVAIRHKIVCHIERAHHP